MKKEINFIIFLIILSVACYGDVSFESCFSFSRSFEGDYVKNLFFADTDENGEDEFYVSYDNYDDYGIWYLVEYNLDGDTISVYQESLDYYEYFGGCKIIKWGGIDYLFAVEDKVEDWEDRYCILTAYEYDTMTLIDSIGIYIGENQGFLGRHVEYNYIERIEDNGTEYLYLGVLLSNSDIDNGTGETAIYKFSFDQGEIGFLEEIPDCGFKLYQCESSEFLTALGNSYTWYEASGFCSCEMNRLSLDTPAEVETIVEVSGTDYCRISYLNSNDHNYQDYGAVVWESDENTFKCYSPDLEEILWEYGTDVHQASQVFEGTCVSTNLGDNYILYFCSINGIDYIQVINRINGNIELSQEVQFIPEYIIQYTQGVIYFIDRTYDTYYVYTLNEVYLDSDANVIEYSEYQVSNYPNPFNPETLISFYLPGKVNVKLEIYNLAGQTVSKLVDSKLNSGYHEYIWKGQDMRGNQVSSGIYYYVLELDDKRVSARKCVLIK